MEEEMGLRPIHLAFILLIVIIVLVAAAGILYLQEQPALDPNSIQVVFETSQGDVYFTCEIADEPLERQEGLMNRETLDQDAGMLFVFESPIDASFWMKNTLISLDIIFINESGYIVNIEEADPQPDTPDNLLTRYESLSPVLWVVEINHGICAAEGIMPGSYVDIIRPGVPVK